MTLRVSEFIAQTLVAHGIRHVFMLTGGGAMFLNDALGHQPGLTPIFNHHEQACAMAAEAYARLSGLPGTINVTTGPGGINALNGVFGAWTDSIPLLVISGQVKRETCLGARGLTELRQLGDQEVDIVAMARPITKYAALVVDPLSIRYHLEKALHLATTGRPGPVWLDIPVDVQAAPVDPADLAAFVPPSPPSLDDALTTHCHLIIDKLTSARRPVILAGSGVRAANALPEFEGIIRQLGIPVVTAWTHDLIASDDPLFCGRPGTIGTRGGNFTVQNADLLLILGSRLNIRQTSYNWAAFAPRACKIQIDIDAAELQKPTVAIDHGIRADLKSLLAQLTLDIAARGHNPQRFADWLDWCRVRQTAYPPVLPRHRAFNGRINPYHFVDTLFDLLDGDDVVACANATACIVPFQVARLKRGQRMFSNSGSASMGYDLPAAIGAYFGAVTARGQQRRIICLAGDGSIMLNLQELQTITHYRLPIKVVVLNNQGYLSIRSSQQNFFGRRTGESPASDVTFPDFPAVARSFGLPACRLDGADFRSHLEGWLAEPGPGLCDVVLDGEQGFEPRMSSRQLEDGRIVTPPLEDMFPFLERDELARNMLDS